MNNLLPARYEKRINGDGHPVLATPDGRLSKPTDVESNMPLSANGTSLSARKERPVQIGQIFAEIIERIATERGGK